jgi:hypothetical protein
VIVNKSKIRGIIDWAGGHASFAEEDFCPLEFEQWSDSDTRKKSFLKGYASVRPALNYDAIMPLLRLSRAIATIGFTVKSHTWENINANLYQRNRRFLDEFFMTQL